MEQLAEEARALIAATGDVAGDRVQESRKRVVEALERGKAICGLVRDKAIKGTKAADKVVHQNFYQTIGIGLVMGALIGYILACQKPCKRVCSNPHNLDLEEEGT